MPLRRFFARIFGASSSSQLEHGVDADQPWPTPALPLEPLSRFVYEEKRLKADRVTERAFLPQLDAELSVFKLSVFIVDGLAHEEIVDIGRSVTERELCGYARVENAHDVTEHALTIERDDTPLRHANICGWPHEKEHQKEIAQALAKAAGVPRRV